MVLSAEMGRTREGKPFKERIYSILDAFPFLGYQKIGSSSWEGKTSVIVGPIIIDVHVQEVPKLKACALRVSSCTWSRILKAREQDPHLQPAGPGLR